MKLTVVLLCVLPLTTAWGITDLIGNGLWSVKKLTKCVDDNYRAVFEISRKKVNRTHDGFNINGILDFTLDESHGIFIDACRYMDGGCKRYQTFADNCACCFFRRHVPNIMVEVLTLAGIDPPDCPLPQGDINITDYVFNYGALPAQGIYGTYDASVYLIGPKVGNKPPQRLACIILTLQFDNY